MWIHWLFFPKTLTKGHWPLDDLWPHVCWGHMCDSTQGSLCPSPMTIHQCMWIQWSILQNTTYIHTYTYYVHTTYYVQNEWSHSLLLNSVQARQKLNSVQARQKKHLFTWYFGRTWYPLDIRVPPPPPPETCISVSESKTLDYTIRTCQFFEWCQFGSSHNIHFLDAVLNKHADHTGLQRRVVSAWNTCQMLHLQDCIYFTTNFTSYRKWYCLQFFKYPAFSCTHVHILEWIF